ncbi:MAG: hypothetical protein JXB88_07930 [Spirochaetales bacterium]|nr:hypothetical protein [Spirochaetales bacterium]
MNFKGFICFVFILILFMVSFPASGQAVDTGSTKEARKVCLFDISRIQKEEKEPGKEPEGEIFTEVIKDTLAFELKVAGFEIIDDAIWKQLKKKEAYSDDDLLEGKNAVILAQKANADVAITGFYMLDQKRILFGIKCYDVKSRRLAVSILKDGQAGVSFISLINNAIEEIIPRINMELSSYSAQGDTIEKEVVVYEDITFKEMIELGTRIKVTLHSVDEDADIYLADTHIGKITGGEISFESKALSVVEVRIEKSKHYTRILEYELGEEDQVIHLPRLGKVTHMAMNAEYTIFQTVGIGIGFRYYILPDWLFIHFIMYPYLQAGYLPETNSVLHIDNNLSVGYYIYFSPSSYFRAGVAVGLGWIPTIIFAPKAPVINDFYWDILGVWIELNLKDFIVYYKITGRFNHNILGDGHLNTGWARPIPVLFSIGVVWKW